MTRLATTPAIRGILIGGLAMGGACSRCGSNQVAIGSQNIDGASNGFGCDWSVAMPGWRGDGCAARPEMATGGVVGAGGVAPTGGTVGAGGAAGNWRCRAARVEPWGTGGIQPTGGTIGSGGTVAAGGATPTGGTTRNRRQHANRRQHGLWRHRAHRWCRGIWRRYKNWRRCGHRRRRRRNGQNLRRPRRGDLPHR